VLSARQAMSLQGIGNEELSLRPGLAAAPEQLQRDLAGNAFSSTVAGVCLATMLAVWERKQLGL
jgi:hypothetical protein